MKNIVPTLIQTCHAYEQVCAPDAIGAHKEFSRRRFLLFMRVLHGSLGLRWLDGVLADSVSMCNVTSLRKKGDGHGTFKQGNGQQGVWMDLAVGFAGGLRSRWGSKWE